MNVATVRRLPSARERRRVLELAIAARRRLDAAPRSR
jgi:hypothetical protein